MYLDKENTEIRVLRQGDVLEGVHTLGAINLNELNYEINSTGEKIATRIPLKPVFGYVMVLSHSCEIDPSNSVKLTSIILAPLRDVNKATSPDKIKELIDSNILDPSSESTYLKYFFIKPVDILPFPDGAVVDFSKCFSIRNKSYETLLHKKVLQLKKDVSNKMALKFALYFFREEKLAKI